MRAIFWRCVIAAKFAAIVLLIVFSGNAFAKVAGHNGGDTNNRRVALIIGNSRYQSVTPLVNPANDAHLVARTLRGLGFTIVGGKEQTDLNKAGFDQVIEQFGNEIHGADVALFYYAGHGVQIHNENYLVPIDANPTKESDVDFQMIDSRVVLHQMEDAGTALNLLILDACRNNPFGGRGLRAFSGGLAQMRAPQGTLISYATQPGNVASDGDKGDSPYSLALVHALRQPGLDVFHVFNQVGLEVERVTHGEQQPWVSNSPINSDFYFAEPPSTQTAAEAASAVPDPDVVFWQSIVNSANSADFRAYLQEFPDGRFAELARLRIHALQQKQASSEVAIVQAPTPRPVISPKVGATHVPASQIASADIQKSSDSPMANFANGFIEIGGSLDKEDAEQMVKRFERFGYHPRIAASKLNTQEYALWFGPYSPAEQANARNDLLQHWHDLTFHLMVNSKTGVLMSRADAEQAMDLIKRFGGHPSLTSNGTGGGDQYGVEIGPYVTQAEAIEAGEKIEQKYSNSANCPWGNCEWPYAWLGSPPSLLCKQRFPCVLDSQ